MTDVETVKIRPFPHLGARERLPNDPLRALFSRAINNEYAFRWINRDYVRGLASSPPPPLNAAGERVARDLTANGLAFANFTEFFDEAFLGKIRDAFGAYRDAFNAKRGNGALKGKEVFLDTIHKAHTFVPNDPVSQYLAAPAFAAISCRYMNMVPRYVGSSFWHTKPAPSDDRVYSQMWHRDYNDRRLVKIFLYLNDVGDNNGFFEYMTGTHIHGPQGKSFDQIGPDGFRAYPDQQAIEKLANDAGTLKLSDVPKDKHSGDAAPWHGKIKVVQCQAPAGTLIFADTFGVHRGGYVKAGHRDMIMSTYSTHYNVHKPHFSVAKEFAAELTPFMRKAFGVDRTS